MKRRVGDFEFEYIGSLPAESLPDNPVGECAPGEWLLGSGLFLEFDPTDPDDEGNLIAVEWDRHGCGWFFYYF